MSFVENKNIWSLAKIQASGNPWVLFWIDSVSFQLPPSIWMRWLVQGAPGPGLILITLFYPVFDPHAYRQMMDEAIWSRTHSSASNLVSFVKIWYIGMSAKFKLLAIPGCYLDRFRIISSGSANFILFHFFSILEFWAGRTHRRGFLT